MSTDIDTHIQGCLGVVRFNRPAKRNAFTPDMEQALREALTALDADPQVKGMLMTGSDSCFSAGIDLSVLGSAPAGPYDISRQHRFSYLPRLRKPLVAAVAGPCHGLAAALALLCDVRYVASNCKIALPFARMGGVAEFGLALTLPRAVGHTRAANWLLTGKLVLAEEALSSGFAADLLPEADFLNQVSQRLQAQWQDASGDALIAMKTQLWRATSQGLSDHCEDAGWLMRELRAKAPMTLPR